ncbi:MAG: hypothetical protein CL623_08085 [Arcobacter sp.]|nr:hypothetical protein [Arcobacter sp.]|tara:strand:- start:4631 stop:6049 length:1419 start_codon:yes stop_codon:yes gene_type:complete
MFKKHNDAKEYISKNNISSSTIIINNCRNDKKLSFVDYENKIINKIETKKIALDIFKQKPVEEEIYDSYSYSNYFQRLLKEDEQTENSYYTNKIERINQLIREDRYNSNVYISARSEIGTDYSDAEKRRYHDSSVDLNWEYRLYDGQKTYIYDQVKRIKEQGAQIKYEDAKNNLALLGSDLYGNLLFSQTLLDVYNGLYLSQENLYEIIYENRKKGLGTITDVLDAKYDLIELEKQVMSFKILHSRNTYLLKQSINSKSNKPLFIMPFNITNSNHSIEEERMLILHNNYEVANAQNLLKDSKVNILSESSRKMPTVDLDASTGYSWSSDLIDDTEDSGIDWNAGIEITVPLYERNDIYLNEQRAKILALQSKNNLKIATKNALNRWDTHKKRLFELNKLNTMLKVQLKGQQEKLSIIKKKYLEGNSDYRDYADSLNRVSLVSIDLVNNMIFIEKEKLLGNYLLGKKIYNVKN